MRMLAGAIYRAPAGVVLLAGLAIVSAAVATQHGLTHVVPVILGIGLIVSFRHQLLRPNSLIGLIVIVVMFVPASGYQIAANLPFDLEPYRLVVALVAVVWVSVLLIDPLVRLEGTVFDRPLLAIVGCILGSELVNEGRVGAYGSSAIKSLTFFLSFVVVYYMCSTALRDRRSVMFIIRLLTACGALVGVSAVVEERKGYDVFDHLQTVFPFLRLEGATPDVIRGGNLRVFASSQHPIALGAAMAMLVPLSIYLSRAYSRRWLVATLFLLLGALASGSRTFITMAIAEVVVYLIVKPRETRRLWPLLLPMVVAVHVFLPGMLGSLKESFFPKGGIVQEQTQVGANYNTQLSGGRIRQLVPMLTEASHHWPLGEGYGTRISGFDVPDRNAPILDNEWLNIVLDVGYAGVVMWGWLIFGAVRRLIRLAKLPSDDDDDWLFLALAASLASLSIGMLTFDAFGFIQVFFLFWIILGVAARLIKLAVVEAPVPVRPVPSTPGRFAETPAW